MQLQQTDQVLTAPQSVWEGRLLRAKRWGATLAEFAFVQGLVQILTAVAGLLIVRTMAKHDYALYAIANSMQVTGNQLADLGIGIGVRSIGGRVWNDRERFGQLVNTALSLRRRFAAMSLAVTLPVSAWMLWRNGAGWGLAAGLCLTIVAGIIPLLQSSVYNSCLQLHAEYRRIQKLDLGNAGLRLGLVGTLAMTRMNALLAVLVGVLSNWVQFTFARRWAFEKAEATAQMNPDDRRELMKLSWKWMPNVIFYCFQGQVTLLILTLFGSSTNIADITALARISALFGVFSITFSSVLAPRFSRCQDTSRLPRLYAALIGGSVLLLSIFLGFAWLLPELFLWLIGNKYSGLRSEFGWVVAASLITQLGSTIWTLNAAKAWIRIQAVAYIPVTIGCQLIGAACLDLRDFHDVLIFGVITAAAPLPCFLLDSMLGLFSRGCRSGE